MKRHILACLMLLISVSIVHTQTKISGKVLGNDGKPIQIANVHLQTIMENKSLSTIIANSDGSFNLSIEKNGYYILHFTGINHKEKKVPLLIKSQKEVEVTIELETYSYTDNFDDVKIIGDFNNFSFRSAEDMIKQQNGTYTAEYKTDKERFAYQLYGIEKSGRSINGTQSDEFEYDGGGDYKSIVKTKNGVAKIIFDPAKLVRNEGTSSITFSDENIFEKKFYSIVNKMEERQNRFNEAAAKNAGISVNLDWSVEEKEIKEEINKESDIDLKKLLHLSYLQLANLGEKNLDKEIIKKVIKEIEPSSLIWAVDPALLNSLYKLSDVGFDTNSADDYTEKVLNENSERGVVGFLLYMKFMEAQSSGNNEARKKYQKRLLDEFADTRYGKIASMIPLDAKINKGNPIPDFSVVSFEDPKVIYSKENMKGKIYLIDFWAAWCKPCVEEMNFLHSAYEKFKDRGFIILSLSFDYKRDDVTKFRSKKWEMPWLHSFVEKGFNSDIAKNFEVWGIPKPVLVDASGNIIATEGELRGENLIKILNEVFKENY